MRLDASGVSGSSAFFDGASYVFSPLMQDSQFNAAFSISLWFLKKGQNFEADIVIASRVLRDSIGHYVGPSVRTSVPPSVRPSVGNKLTIKELHENDKYYQNSPDLV